MKSALSVQARLSIVSLLLFLLIFGFGLFTLRLFNDVNGLTDDLRQRWLPSTRLLGDLNNSTSDYRTAEGDLLLAPDIAGRAARAAIMGQLRADVARSQAAYLRLVHGPDELALYATFAARWRAYSVQADHVLVLAGEGQLQEAVTLYGTGSRAAYDAASDSLGLLTDRTVGWAQAASARTAHAFHAARGFIVLALLLAGGLLAGSVAYIRRLISNPLVDMARTMRTLAANHTEIEVAGVNRKDEIGEMARAVTVFRANAVQLIESQRGLAEQAAHLEEQLAYEQQLTRLQRNFVVMVSHEFRTPLTIIDAHAQRLINAQAPAASSAVADRAARIRSCVQRITNLMDSLLTSARLIDGEAKLVYNPAEMDLVALVKDVCLFHRETAPHADIRETFEAALPMVGDRKLLFQAFSNLLSNAIKYSPGGGAIELSATQDGANVVVAVSDQGLGIPQHDLAKLFTRYYRGGNTAGIVGTGVGLYLTHMVVELHGGMISVVSAEGKGSTFTVTLPAERGKDTRAAPELAEGPISVSMR